jgi:NAD+ synthase (glutamine-hydrolysing)
MDRFGFARVSAASPEMRVGDCEFNRQKIVELIDRARSEGAEFLVFPELCITGYTCADLFRQSILLERAMDALMGIADHTRGSNMVVMAGLPLSVRGSIYNCAAVIQDGNILGIVPKSHIPGYNEYYETRWFAGAEELELSGIPIGGKMTPIGNDLLFTCENNIDLSFGVEICEDVWVPAPPSGYLAQAGAVLLFNLSASDEAVGKAEYRKSLVESQSARCNAGYVYADSNIGESTTDLVFGGHCIIAENGIIKAESERFHYESSMITYDIDVQGLLYTRSAMRTFKDDAAGLAFREIPFRNDTVDRPDLLRQIEAHPFVPGNKELRDQRCREILSIQTSGLMKRLSHTGSGKAVVGISGGLDSTLALIVAMRTMDRLKLPANNVMAVTMPGFGTSGRTYQNAVDLAKGFGAELRVIDIKDACSRHFKDIGHDPEVRDTTYENVQARERTQVLMDLANKHNGIVVGTGDMSELALGWCTYNGDHMSMYGVNSGVPKTLVRYIIQWYADFEAGEDIRKILYDIIDTPISPELLPPSQNGDISQKTEDLLGPYEVHDFFLYHMIRWGASPAKILSLAVSAFKGAYGRDQLLGWLRVFCRRFFSQQFKRSCMPDGPKVGSISLSPRGDWRMPSDMSAAVWMKELEGLQD